MIDNFAISLLIIVILGIAAVVTINAIDNRNRCASCGDKPDLLFRSGRQWICNTCKNRNLYK